MALVHLYKIAKVIFFVFCFFYNGGVKNEDELFYS